MTINVGILMSMTAHCVTCQERVIWKCFKKVVAYKQQLSESGWAGVLLLLALADWHSFLYVFQPPARSPNKTRSFGFHNGERFVLLANSTSTFVQTLRLSDMFTIRLVYKQKHMTTKSLVFRQVRNDFHGFLLSREWLPVYVYGLPENKTFPVSESFTVCRRVKGRSLICTWRHDEMKKA